MSKYVLATLFFIYSCVLLTNGAAIDSSDKNSDLAAKLTDSNEMAVGAAASGLRQGEYEALMSAVERGLLAQAILEQLDAANDDGEPIERDARVATVKRFPKWRSGETRSRVKLLHQAGDLSEPSLHKSADYNPPLRKIWEKNMREKNRMYESLLG